MNNDSNPYIQISPTSAGRRPMDTLCDALNRCGKRMEHATRKAETLADNFWHHLRTSPSLSDAAMARLVQGTKLLTEGGSDKVFQQEFNFFAGEKLLKAYVCYLSTSSGPVIGTLYVSTKRVAFCSDFPLSHYSPTGSPDWMHYKVVLQVDQIRRVSPTANRLNPSERYIHVVTNDNYEFWFMGFISYDKALSSLNHVLHNRD